MNRLGPAAASDVNVHFHEFLSLDCTHFISLRVCMHCNSRNNIWRFPPRDTLCRFQNSSLSDNKMTKRGIIILVMRGVSGCTLTNSFHTRRSCMSAGYSLHPTAVRWMSEQRAGRFFSTYVCYVLSVLPWDLLPTRMTCSPNRSVMKQMVGMNGRLLGLMLY